MFGKVLGNILSVTFWVACFRYIGTTLFLVVVLGLGWSALGPQKPTPDTARQSVADKVIASAADDLRRERGDIKRVAVMHFRNDSTDYLTLQFREKLSSSGTFDVNDTGVAEKFRNLLSLRNPGCFSVAEAVKYGRDAEVQAVIIGDVDTFESIDSGAILKGTIRMVDVRTGNIISEIAFHENSTKTFAAKMRKAVEMPQLQHEASSMPWYLRFLLYVSVVLLLPVVTIAFIRQMVAKRSNGCNAFVLSIYTVIDAIIAFFMIGGTFGSESGVILFIAATALAFLYNISMMTFALRLES